MLIVRLTTGLGNQMYEYMAGYALARELHQELVLDIENCTRSAYGYLLDHFNIPVCRKIIYAQDSTGGGDDEFYDRTLDLWGDMVILVRTKEQKDGYEDNDRMIVYSDWEMVEGFRDYKNLYMYGYFLERRIYFNKYWEEVKTFFTLKEENEDVRDFRKLIQGRTSVGIHIRRGDILLMDWFCKVEDDYYRAAIECCRELYGDCVFCVFSDDIQYAKKMLGWDESIHYVHFDGYDDASVNEFYCLSLCDHRILTALSTFGLLADELHQGSGSHSFMWDTDESTKGIPLEKKSGNKRILLNKEDIRRYSTRYQMIHEEMAPPDAGLPYLRFKRLVEENRSHEALQAAFCLYHDKKGSVEFGLYLARALMWIGAYEEAVVELAKLSQDAVKQFLSDLILDESKKKQLASLYEGIKNIGKKHFVIVLEDEATPAYETCGLFDLAIVLSHIGHDVTIVYDTIDAGKYYFQQSNMLHNARGINMECFHVEKETVINSGICDFYNGFEEDELIIISEDKSFFDRSDCSKKLQFIISDEEYGSEELFDKADYILTQQKELAEDNSKYIYWQEQNIQGQYVLISFPWEYGYGQRLNRRMIKMAEALLKSVANRPDEEGSEQ